MISVKRCPCTTTRHIPEYAGGCLYPITTIRACVRSLRHPPLPCVRAKHCPTVAGTSKFKPIDFLHLSGQDRRVMHVCRIAGYCLSSRDCIARSIHGQIVAGSSGLDNPLPHGINMGSAGLHRSRQPSAVVFQFRLSLQLLTAQGFAPMQCSFRYNHDIQLQKIASERLFRAFNLTLTPGLRRLIERPLLTRFEVRANLHG